MLLDIIDFTNLQRLAVLQLHAIQRVPFDSKEFHLLKYFFQK